jgi:hypothetical protein
MDVVNFVWYDPAALFAMLVRYTLLGGVYTAVAGVVMVFVLERIGGLRLAS